MPTALPITVHLTQPQALRHVEEDVYRTVHTAEQLLAWAHSEHRYICQAVHALRIAHWQRSID